ncbi:uncharacterized protein LOC143568494 [Bidens hawaiensis]|uniref:uncharacterized protein LOC143568494 n=1 Tax=Bidens hawaiensis TaxID=980011 RepID=UPI00404B2139
MRMESTEAIHKCEACQLHAPVKSNPKHNMVPTIAIGNSTSGEWTLLVPSPKQHGRYDKKWVKELPSVLWAIRTTEKTSHDKTPYNLIFGSEAVIPTKIGVNSRRVRNINDEANDSEVLLNLDLLKEAREQASIKEDRYKTKLEAFYNIRVRKEVFKPGCLVLTNKEASRKSDTGKLGPKWGGPMLSKKLTGADPISSMTWKEGRCHVTRTTSTSRSF